MKLSIEQMTLRLPSGFQDRAGEISRLVGEELGSLRISESLVLESLEVPVVQVRADAENGEVARAIAFAIAERIGGAL